jgi:hypothetical protein
MFVLIFRYVFGGSIDIPGVSYVDYLVAGIMVQTVAFSSQYTVRWMGDYALLEPAPTAASAVLTLRASRAMTHDIARPKRTTSPTAATTSTRLVRTRKPTAYPTPITTTHTNE